MPPAVLAPPPPPPPPPCRVFTGALLSAGADVPRPDTIGGDVPRPEELLAAVDADVPVPRGTYKLRVDATDALAVGDVVTLSYGPGGGALAAEM